MNSEEFINKNSSPYEFWEGFDGRLIGKLDALEACKLAYNEALDDVLKLVDKYSGVSVQLSDIIQREALSKKKKI